MTVFYMKCNTRLKWVNVLTIKVPTTQNGQTHSVCRKQLTNCLSLFDHFVGLVLKGLNY